MAEFEKKEKVLCMLSGGLDSLAVLYLLLTRPEYEDKEIHVHHLILKNIEQRALAEKAACQRILTYFREHSFKDFGYSESFHDTTFLKKYFIFDTVMYYFIAANMVINDSSIRQVAVGFIKEEFDNKEALNRLNKGRNVFYECLPEETKFQRELIFPLRNYFKKDVWKLLPADLRTLAWSCRRPIYKDNKVYACEKCKTCKAMVELQKA
jgi:7-cyano-7-deazaguanine synthase in queuosine biosynthesis